MALTEIQLKICRFHGSFSQKGFPTPVLEKTFIQGDTAMARKKVCPVIDDHNGQTSFPDLVISSRLSVAVQERKRTRCRICPCPRDSDKTKTAAFATDL